MNSGTTPPLLSRKRTIGILLIAVVVLAVLFSDQQWPHPSAGDASTTLAAQPIRSLTASYVSDRAASGTLFESASTERQLMLEIDIAAVLHLKGLGKDPFDLKIPLNGEYLKGLTVDWTMGCIGKECSGSIQSIQLFATPFQTFQFELPASWASFAPTQAVKGTLAAQVQAMSVRLNGRALASGELSSSVSASEPGDDPETAIELAPPRGVRLKQVALPASAGSSEGLGVEITWVAPREEGFFIQAKRRIEGGAWEKGLGATGEVDARSGKAIDMLPKNLPGTIIEYRFQTRHIREGLSGYSDQQSIRIVSDLPDLAVHDLTTTPADGHCMDVRWIVANDGVATVENPFFVSVLSEKEPAVMAAGFVPGVGLMIGKKYYDGTIVKYSVESILPRTTQMPAGSQWPLTLHDCAHGSSGDIQIIVDGVHINDSTRVMMQHGSWDNVNGRWLWKKEYVFSDRSITELDETNNVATVGFAGCGQALCINEQCDAGRHECYDPQKLPDLRVEQLKVEYQTFRQAKISYLVVNGGKGALKANQRFVIRVRQDGQETGRTYYVAGQFGKPVLSDGSDLSHNGWREERILTSITGDRFESKLHTVEVTVDPADIPTQTYTFKPATTLSFGANMIREENKKNNTAATTFTTLLSTQVCSGVSADLLTDRNHCGQCGGQCDQGLVCQLGACIKPVLVASATATLEQVNGTWQLVNWQRQATSRAIDAYPLNGQYTLRGVDGSGTLLPAVATSFNIPTIIVARKESSRWTAIAAPSDDGRITVAMPAPPSLERVRLEYNGRVLGTFPIQIP